ncbi:hypothetical protein [Sphingosinicella sp. BN140058]|uniref:hypothetical protein n=1 Tax=Sphingosinicella sp. BN140058 TaxID=1892855 RepID=UPI0010117A24|nr:hypothetical protein [Sphingosinicella sp. BN140058]QAY79343.1 hypothetical protein ETR14_24470 [Sphingosinicella sp. BN140058]
MTKRKLAGMAALLLACLATTPAVAAWKKAESENFILYGQVGEDKLRAKIALLEDYNSFLRSLTGVQDPPSPNKLRLPGARPRRPQDGA